MLTISKLMLTLPIVAAGLFMFPGEAAAQCASCGAATLNLPTLGVSYGGLVRNDTTLAAVAGGLTSFRINLNVPSGSWDVSAGSYNAWCADFHSVTASGNFPSVKVYPSLSPSLPAGTALPAGRYNQINWVLNNKSGTIQDVQNAIWLLITGETPTPPSPAATALFNNAVLYGTNFVPGARQVTAVLVRVDGIQAGGFQDLMIEVPVPDCGTIGDFVWSDTNRNGTQDAGEAGINGVTVNLRNAQNVILASTVTSTFLGQPGYYQFRGLCANTTYKVEADLSSGPLAGMASSPTGGTSDAALDSNPNGDTVVLPTDRSSNQTIDFGFHTPCTGRIGDLVWNDVNRNGIQDAGEAGISGVRVTITGPGGYSASAITDGSGAYNFTGLCGGQYTVAVDASTVPAGFSATPTGAGNNTAVDSNGSPATVTLNSDNATDITIDFGYAAACTGSIGDFVFTDLNGNGIQDANEGGINGVTLQLRNASTDALLATTTTMQLNGVNGAYQFGGLCAGNYKVVITAGAPADHTASPVAATGSTPANDSNGSPALVTLAQNATDTTIDFGFVPPCSGRIGDLIFNDANGNGIQDPGEGPIGGVTVNLHRLSDNFLLQTTTSTTAVGANYEFTGLCTGQYRVEVVPPAGFIASPVNAGSNTAIDSNPNPAAVTLATNLASDVTIDFGFYQPASLGDRVWTDTNGNGVQEPSETGISGLTVTLKNNTGATLATTTAGANGIYGFNNLVAGTYTVCVTAPNGMTQSYDLDGVATANCATASVAAGQNRLDVDFGYYQPAALGDLVWTDVNANGVQDAGETGIGGVSLQISGANGYTATTTTNASGIYSFGNLPAGSYTVCATQPSGMEQTYDLDGLATANCAAATLTAGQTRLDVDFGYRVPCNSTIGDFVWFDADGDGLQDSGEFGLPNVTVELLNGAGTVVGMATTDTTGAYRFSNLCTGTYSVRVKAPSGPSTEKKNRYQGLLATTANAGSDQAKDSNANPFSVTITPGTTNLTIDYGFKSSGWCTLTQGYWKNHAEAWPVQTLVLGNQTYTKAELLAILNTPVSGDRSISLAYQLIAAKLNLYSGATVPSTVNSTIFSADTLFAQYPGKLPYGISSSSSADTYGTTLDKYNNGLLGPKHCQ